MPKPLAGPVSGRLMPIVRSANAGAAPIASAAASRRCRAFMAGSPLGVSVDGRWQSQAHGLDVLWNRNRADALGVGRVAGREGAHLGAFAQHVVAALDHVAMAEHLQR